MRTPISGCPLMLQPFSPVSIPIPVWESGEMHQQSAGIPGISPGGRAGARGQSLGMWCQSILFWERCQS